MKLFLLKKLSLLVLLVFLFTSQIVLSQEPIGGPYTPDANTMLLLHFDGNLNNASSFSADGIGHGTYYFLPSPLGTGMGNCIRFKNDALSDSSYVVVPDTSYLDLTGSFTVEGWINVFTFGDQYGDHRWVPRLCIKPGDQNFWQPNWWVEMWGDRRVFHSGFHTADGANWPSLTSRSNLMQVGKWYHLTFIRDDDRKILIQLVHDQNKNLLDYQTTSYANLPVQTPMVNSNGVHMGWAGGASTDSWLDGFIDEVRVSNIVRNFAVPPIITDVTRLNNQSDATLSYPVTCQVMPFAPTGTIQTVELRYSTDKGQTWTSIAMTKDSLYRGTIPKQNFGTIVQYYVYALDANGQSATYPPAGFDYLSFAVYKNNTLILNLDFEEGQGAPIDKSDYHNTVTVLKNVYYSNEAKFGNYSFHSTYSVAGNDSNWLEVNSPFLSSPNFCVDVWVKADSFKHAVRILNLPNTVDTWNNNNFSIDIRNNAQNIPRFGGRFWPDGGTAMMDVMADSIPKLNTWYRLIFERQDSLVVFQMRDENNNLIQEVKKAAGAKPPIAGLAPLRIGRAYTLSDNPWYIPPYFGKIDNLKIYNYGAVILNPTGVDNKLNPPYTFELYQNYPNPFNPTTSIKFTLPKAEKVELAVFDLLGRKVKTLVNDYLHAGENMVSWDGKNEIGESVASGIYFYSLVSDNNFKVRKMMLLK